MGRGIAFALIILWISNAATGRPVRRTPSSKQFQAQERAADCGILQGIKSKFQTSLRDLNEELDRESESLQLFYAELEQCAIAHRLPFDTDDEESEGALAVTCADEYERWVNRGYRVLMLEDEMGSAREKRAEAARHLDQCPTLSQRKANQAPLRGDLF